MITKKGGIAVLMGTCLARIALAGGGVEGEVRYKGIPRTPKPRAIPATHPDKAAFEGSVKK